MDRPSSQHEKADPTQTTSSSESISDVIFDKQLLLQNCGDQPDLAERYCNKLMKTINQDIERLERKIHEGRAQEVFEMAHKIKGALAVAGSPRCRDLLQAIDRHARHGNLEEAPKRLSEFSEAFEAFVIELYREFLTSNPSVSIQSV